MNYHPVQRENLILALNNATRPTLLRAERLSGQGVVRSKANTYTENAAL
jgi:hypothetical protein